MWFCALQASIQQQCSAAKTAQRRAHGVTCRQGWCCSPAVRRRAPPWWPCWRSGSQDTYWAGRAHNGPSGGAPSHPTAWLRIRITPLPLLRNSPHNGLTMSETQPSIGKTSHPFPQSPFADWCGQLNELHHTTPRDLNLFPCRNPRRNQRDMYTCLHACPCANASAKMWSDNWSS